MWGEELLGFSTHKATQADLSTEDSENYLDVDEDRRKKAKGVANH